MTSDESLRLQARQTPVIGVFSLVDGSAQEQTHDEILSGAHNNPRSKPRVRPSAATVPVSGPSVAPNQYLKVSVPYRGMQHGLLSASQNSDDTPVSANDPFPYPIQNIYTVGPGSASGQQYDNSGV